MGWWPTQRLRLLANADSLSDAAFSGEGDRTIALVSMNSGDK
jgi:hypothetical protein